MEVCGRALNVGRPRGYVEPAVPLALPPVAPPPPPGPNGAVGAAGALGGLPSAVSDEVQTVAIKLENMISDEMLSADDEYKEVVDDIREECSLSGPVADVVIPRDGAAKGLCFVRFETVAAAAAARRSLDRRQFDGNVVKASFIEPAEVDGARA